MLHILDMEWNVTTGRRLDKRPCCASFSLASVFVVVLVKEKGWKSSANGNFSIPFSWQSP